MANDEGSPKGGLANSVMGMARRRRRILPLPRGEGRGRERGAKPVHGPNSRPNLWRCSHSMNAARLVSSRASERRCRELGAPLLHPSEFVEVTELTPLRHNEVAVTVNRSAVRRVADAVLPLVLRQAEIRPLLLVGIIPDLRRSE